MNVLINPINKALNGTINAPASKSYSHRVFIAAGLTNGISIIKNPLISGDVSITLAILKQFGVDIEKINSSDYSVKGIDIQRIKINEKIIDCGNSGTSFRIFSALSLLVKGGLIFKGIFLKRKRPIIPLLDTLKNLGGKYEFKKEKLYIYRESRKCDPKIKIRADLTSQFVTALLFLCPFIKCNNLTHIELEITTEIVSKPYINITLEVLRKFQISIKEKSHIHNKRKYVIDLNQKFKPKTYLIPGDFSSVAFIIAAVVMNPIDSKVTINNLDFSSLQGDKEFINILKKMGAKLKINYSQKSLVVYGNIKKNPLKGLNIDCRNIPDLFPILSVIGIFARGKTILYNIKSLRVKESDRVAVMKRELKKMGVEVIEEENSFTVFHLNKELSINEINYENDHRIAMSLICAVIYGNIPIKLKNIEIIKDSYPEFLTDLRNLGVNIKNLN